MAGPNDFDTIRTSILRQTTDNTVIIAMLVGAGLESDWRIDDGGGGAFQITDPLRPKSGVVFFLPGSGTPVATSAGGQQFDIGNAGNTQIDLDVHYMLPRYEAAAQVHKNDAEGPDKYANIAYDAERPAQPYQKSQGEAKVQQVYSTVVGNYGNVNAQATASTSVNNPAAAFLQPVISFLGALTDVHLWRSLGWIVLGLLIMIIGLIMWLRKSAGHLLKSVI